MGDELEEIRKKKMEKLKKKFLEGDKMEIDVNDDNFQKEVIEKSKEVPVVVDFWASWCMPCQILGPVLEKLTEDYNGKFVLAKANVDQCPNTSSTFGIMGIPAVKMFKNGKVIDEFVGAQPEPNIRAWLDKNM